MHIHFFWYTFNFIVSFSFHWNTQGSRGPPGVPGLPGKKGPRVSLVQACLFLHDLRKPCFDWCRVIPVTPDNLVAEALQDHPDRHLL